MGNDDDWGSPGVKREPKDGLRCDSCGGEDFDGPDDGFYYCRVCGAQSQDKVDATADHEDIHGDAGQGAIYSILHHRKSQGTKSTPSAPRNLSQNPTAVKVEAPESSRFDQGLQDFGTAGDPFPDAAAIADGIRLRYTQGLQVMLQRQCEALVEKFGVSPMICGIAGTVWLRYLAASRVFDEDWADRLIAASEVDAEAARRRFAKQGRRIKRRIKAKFRMEPHNKYGRRAVSIWFNSLKKMIPLHSSVAVSFLACHLVRETILPTDIFEWALEGKFPYLTAFVDMDKYLGPPSHTCPLSSRLMFRPNRVIGAWKLEATAGSVAQSIGLRIPSVNFHAIACRYLKELSLPTEKILPHACRLYEWSLPPDLWLSSNYHRLPTRICVMSILIIVIRILYNIHGKGMWELSLSDSRSSPLRSQNLHVDPSVKSETRSDNGGKGCHSATDLVPVTNLSQIQSSEFNIEELLRVLETSFYSTHTAHDYSQDLKSYLKYCKDIVFTGRTTPFEEERLIDRLWNMHEKQEDYNIKEVKLEHFDSKEKRPRDVSTSTLIDAKKPKDERQDKDSLHMEGGELSNNASDSGGTTGEHLVRNLSSRAARDARIEDLKHDMEENGFQYLPPRVKIRNNGYLHYRRQRADGKLAYVAHADYYLLLRACARLARVDVWIMHLGVLKLERRLEWLEERIESNKSSSSEGHSFIDTTPEGPRATKTRPKLCKKKHAHTTTGSCQDQKEALGVPRSPIGNLTYDTWI